MRLVIGIPARNAADNIAALADRLEAAAAGLQGWDVELVLAYQDSSDDTLDRWRARPARVAQRVLRCPGRRAGKGRNVALLVDHAVACGADHLLLIDADLRAYAPGNLLRFVAAARRDGHGLVLPLWCRAPGQGNTTNYLASPLLYAVYGSRVRQPLAGHALLDASLCRRLQRTTLPDDYGVDIAVVVAALTGGCSVGQVTFPTLHHTAGVETSAGVMRDVATAALAHVARSPSADRSDVRWPPAYWRSLRWSSAPDRDRGFARLLERHVRSRGDLHHWRRLAHDPSERARDAWCAALAEGLASVVDGGDPGATADALVAPFLAHAWHRVNYPPSTLREAETYVADLGDRLAQQVPAARVA